MTIVCPGCGRRYKLGDDVLGRGPRRLRCRGCGQVFDAGSQGAAPGNNAPDEAPRARGQAPEKAPAAAATEEAPLALIADLDPQSSALARRTLEALGCQVHSVNDGEQAFRFAVTRHPRLLVLHLKLPKLSGLAVCEGVKSSPDLRETRVVLFGPPGWLARAERLVPTSRFADERFEAGVAPAELSRRLALLLGAAGSSAPALPEAGVARQAERSPTASDPRDPRAEIRRMARAILSDLKCYHPDIVRKAVLSGRFLEVFKSELAQCKEVAAQRFPDVPDRLVLLSSALKEGIDEERAQAV